jgi:hypothetical protein
VAGCNSQHLESGSEETYVSTSKHTHTHTHTHIYIYIYIYIYRERERERERERVRNGNVVTSANILLKGETRIYSQKNGKR